MPKIKFNWTILCLATVMCGSGCTASRTKLSLPLAQSEARSAKTEFLNEQTDVHQTTEATDVDKVMPYGPLVPPSSASSDVSDGDIQPVSHELDAAPVSDVSSEPIVVSQNWSLATIESLALQQNPAVLQASASAHKAMGYRGQVGLKPNPIVGYQGSQLADRGTDQHVAFVEQDIVLGDKLRKNQRVLNQEIQSQLWEVETQRFRVLTDIRQRFYEALAAQRRMELAAEFEELAIKGVTFAEVRVSAKEGTRPEVLQAEIQLKQIQLQRRQASAAFTGAWKQLMATAGMPDVQPGTLDGVLSDSVEAKDWAAIKAQILAASPELQGARARLARARANVDRQQAQAIPNLSLLVGAGRDNGTGSGMINTQVGLPLPIHNKNQGNIAAAHAEFCRASQDVRRTELSIEARIAEVSRDYESAAAAVDQYHLEILPRAQETLELAEQGYKAGEFDFLQVLIARRTFFDANLEYVTAQVSLAKASVLADGQVLVGGLETTRDTEFDSGLRDQTMSGQ
ncbi:MAG: TolC family protein [Planctomycetaceae bacterium]